MLDAVVLSAVFFGLLSAATLPLGAAIGMIWRPTDRAMAVMLAFGGGALMATLTIDLVAPGVEHGHFGAVATGAVLGGVVFKVFNALLNKKGGYLRKPSTAMTHWRSQARKRLHDVLVHLRRTQPLGALSRESEDKMLSVMLVRDFPEGTTIFGPGDPGQTLYFIEEGEIELIDPRAGDKVIDRLTRYDALGLFGFATGLPHTTEAVAVRTTRVLMIPRDDYMSLLPDSDELRSIMARRIGGQEIANYLVSRHGMSERQVAAWQQKAVEALETQGRFVSPGHDTETPELAMALLKNLRENDFFEGLSEPALNAVARVMIHKTHRPGHVYYQRGQTGDRFYVLASGTVDRIDPTKRHRAKSVVKPGESFGGFAFLTEGEHAVSAIGHDRSEVYELRRADFDKLLEDNGELRAHVSAYLKGQSVSQYIAARHELEPDKAAQWVERAATSIEHRRAFPALSDMTKAVSSHGSAAMAIYLGILLDGIPESFVIGAHATTNGVTVSLVGALFLANLPEALSSAAGMKEQGLSARNIMAMWTSLMVITGVGAGVGAVLLRGAPDEAFAFIEGLAVGAMLTVIAETMLPEAFHKGGGVVGLSTLAGFLATAFFSTLG